VQNQEKGSYFKQKGGCFGGKPNTLMCILLLDMSPAGPLPAWDTRGGEEFSERGPNFASTACIFHRWGTNIFL